MPIGERKKVVKFINEVKQNPSILIRSKSNATTTKPAIPTSHDPKPPRLSKIITKPPIPLPEGARRSLTKDTNLTKNDYANVLVYDNEQMKDNFEELPRTKMNNLENNMLEPEESYIEMGNNLSNHEDYLTPNRSLLTIENQLEEPNYEAPPEKPTAPSPIKVGSASDKKVKLKLGARKLPALPASTYQSQNENLNNNQISVNVEKQCNKPPGSLSFLHGTLMKNILSKQKKVVVGNTSVVEDDVKHQEEAKSVPKSLPEILNIKQHVFKGLKKTSEKECKPPLMPKANKPLPRLPLQDDHEAIYENATDQGELHVIYLPQEISHNLFKHYL
nr:unnamed protein product [Callosobruchus chinensis]